MNGNRPSLCALLARAILAAGLALTLTACQGPRPAADWRATLEDELPRLGHRNFIVIADAAYPLQVNPGIRTVLADGTHLEVVDAVLEAVAASGHVRPVVWLDAEFEHVPEGDAPGVERLRQAMARRFADLDVRRAPHEELIHKLDETADLYEPPRPGIFAPGEDFRERRCRPNTRRLRQSVIAAEWLGSRRAKRGAAVL